jgi:hypothetical protein
VAVANVTPIGMSAIAIPAVRVLRRLRGIGELNMWMSSYRSSADWGEPDWGEPGRVEPSRSTTAGVAADRVVPRPQERGVSRGAGLQFPRRLQLYAAGRRRPRVEVGAQHSGSSAVNVHMSPTLGLTGE